MARQYSFPIHFIARRPEAERTPAQPAPAAKRPEFWSRLPGSNIVVLGAATGFALGLILWGFIALSVLGAVDGLLTQSAKDPTAVEATEAEVLNCANFGAVRALSTDDEARYQAQCGAAAPASNGVTTPAPYAPVSAPQAPVATTGNRANCDQIRGTSYLSGDERTWYLANCVRR